MRATRLLVSPSAACQGQTQQPMLPRLMLSAAYISPCLLDARSREELQQQLAFPEGYLICGTLWRAHLSREFTLSEDTCLCRVRLRSSASPASIELENLWNTSGGRISDCCCSDWPPMGLAFVAIEDDVLPRERRPTIMPFASARLR